MESNTKNNSFSEGEIQGLIRRVQDGETAAFDDVYREYADAVYRFVRFKVSHDQVAEDLTSQVFVKVWQALDRYRPKNGAKFSTWLFQIARFTVIDHYRTSKEVDDIEVHSYRLSSSEDIEEKMSRDQESEMVRQFLDRLPEKYQTVLTLRFINDLSVKEAAEVLKTSEGHVRVLQHRALKKMRSIMGESKELETVFEKLS